MITHTPGPWEAIDRKDARGNIVCGITIIAHTEEANGACGSLVICRLPDGAGTKGGGCWPHQSANARLIAAAPDLLAVVREIERALDLCLTKDGAWTDMPPAYKRVLYDVASAAVARAEGR